MGQALPDDIEAQGTLRCPTYGVSYSQDWMRTPGIDDHFYYGSGFGDIEDYCMHREMSWDNGDADREDWSDTIYSKQWN